MFLRLRQLCLVARELEPTVQSIADVFDVSVCHRDPAVAKFGLENALLAFGSTFVEVVAPTTEGTAAGRYLHRRGGDSGYMVILDTDDLARWRTRADAMGIRIAASLATGDYAGLQLHPKDTGGALLEINTTRGGADIGGAYGPAGPHWPSYVKRRRVAGISGAAVQSGQPAMLAERWSQLLAREVVRREDEYHIDVDNAVLRFIATADGRGEGLAEIDVSVLDAPAVLNAAQGAAHRVDESSVWLGGVCFRIRH